MESPWSRFHIHHQGKSGKVRENFFFLESQGSGPAPTSVTDLVKIGPDKKSCLGKKHKAPPSEPFWLPLFFLSANLVISRNKISVSD